MTSIATEWVFRTRGVEQAEALARQLKVPRLVAQLLLNRHPDSSTDGEAARFLAPQLTDLYAPDDLPGAVDAGRRLARAVRDNKRIVLYGDYDVDGTTGMAILWHALRMAGADPKPYVPHRVEEGYGLNEQAVRNLADEGADLIVTIDCGVTAVNEARILRDRGVALIVTDHHRFEAELPAADAIVHPMLCESPANEHLCGAGVAYKVAWALAREVCGSARVQPEWRTLLMELLPLAALGTIADVVPLIGENRVIARHGLERLPHSRVPGLIALIESAGLTRQRISGYDVGFKLAPRINAAGRMGHARLAVELLTSADVSRGREIAIYLEDHNRKRQATERRITKQAIARVESENLAGDHRRALVLAEESWHPGVIGIVASRLVRRFHRPTVLIALAGDEGQGSGRSIDAFHLAEALSCCKEELLAHGGHAMAAGLRITTDRIASFTERFVDHANGRLTGRDLIPKLTLDAEVGLGELDMTTTETIDALGPFGCGNPRPKLATGWLALAGEPRCVGSGGDHLQATFRENGSQIRAIGFKLGGAIEDLKHHRRCRVAFEPIINDFNGRRSVEMQMLDLKFPER